MSLFIETIRLVNGEIMNLSYHQQRLNQAREQVLGLSDHPLLEKVINIPCGLDQGLFKCRVLYGEKVDLIEYEPYQKMEVHTLKLLASESISYDHKYRDRTALTELFSQRGDCDDILVIKAGCVTDSYVANVVFWDGEGWFTPDTPLLAGTMRASLLDKGILKEVRIMQKDLAHFRKLRLINALNDLSGGTDIPMEAIIS